MSTQKRKFIYIYIEVLCGMEHICIYKTYWAIAAALSVYRSELREVEW